MGVVSLPADDGCVLNVGGNGELVFNSYGKLVDVLLSFSAESLHFTCITYIPLVVTLGLHEVVVTHELQLSNVAPLFQTNL